LLNTGTLDVLAHHEPTRWLHGTAGASTMFQPNDSRGPIFLIPSGTTISNGAFLFEEASVGRFTLTAGGRLDNRRISVDANPTLARTATTRSWAEPTGDLGLMFRATPVIALVANVGSAWRAPTFFELYANGPHLAESRYEVGLESMSPERTLDGDLAIRIEAGRLRGEISGFRNEIGNYIYTLPTSQRLGGLQVYKHLQGDARLTGADVWVEAQLAPMLVARARHDFVNGTLKATGEPLPIMPPPRTSGELEWRGVSSTASRHLGAEVEYTANQRRLNAQDFATAGYTLLNVDAGTGFAIGRHQFQLDVAVRNAANKQYKNFLSRYKTFAYEPGRNIVFRMSTNIW
jgi:iron complex outermembrane receptor protein